LLDDGHAKERPRALPQVPQTKGPVPARPAQVSEEVPGRRGRGELRDAAARVRREGKATSHAQANGGRRRATEAAEARAPAHGCAVSDRGDSLIEVIRKCRNALAAIHGAHTECTGHPGECPVGEALAAAETALVGSPSFAAKWILYLWIDGQIRPHHFYSDRELYRFLELNDIADERDGVPVLYALKPASFAVQRIVSVRPSQ
jgi:hypothetical protein